jgi:hypothetical protein
MAGRATPSARAFVLGKHALALSIGGEGNKSAALRVLNEVRDTYERAGAVSVSGEPHWTSIYGWAYLRDDEGHCYRNLGMGMPAAEAAGDALRARGSMGYTRLQAFSTAVKAAGYAQANEVEQACVTGHELVALAGRLESARVTSRLAELLDALTPHGELAAVQELRDAARPLLARPATYGTPA